MFTFINITLTISLCEIRAMMQQLANMALNSQGGRSKGLRLQGLFLKPQEYSCSMKLQVHWIWSLRG